MRKYEIWETFRSSGRLSRRLDVVEASSYEEAVGKAQEAFPFHYKGGTLAVLSMEEVAQYWAEEVE